MRAFNLLDCNSGPAPKEWEEIPEIKEARPKLYGKLDGVKIPIGEHSLQKIDGLNVCLWRTNNGDGFWKPSSDLFYIRK